MGHFLDSIMEWNTVIVALTGGGIYTAISRLVKSVMVKQKEQDNFLDNLKRANLATLHNDVYQSGKRYIDLGQITVEELDNFGYLFSAYKALGGNGTGDAINDRVNGLPIVSGHLSEIEEVSHFVGKDNQGNYVRKEEAV